MRIRDWSSDVCSSDLRQARSPWESSVTRSTLPTARFFWPLTRRNILLAWICRLTEAGPWVFELIDIICENTALESESARLRAARKGAALAGQGTWTFSLTFRSGRSEEHTSELQSLMRTSYAVFCLKKKKDADTNLALPTDHTIT